MLYYISKIDLEANLGAIKKYFLIFSFEKNCIIMIASFILKNRKL